MYTFEPKHIQTMVAVHKSYQAMVRGETSTYTEALTESFGKGYVAALQAYADSTKGQLTVQPTTASPDPLTKSQKATLRYAIEQAKYNFTLDGRSAVEMKYITIDKRPSGRVFVFFILSDPSSNGLFDACYSVSIGTRGSLKALVLVHQYGLKGDQELAGAKTRANRNRCCRQYHR